MSIARKRFTFYAIVALSALALSYWLFAAVRFGGQLRFKPERVVGPQPPITHFPILEAGEADRKLNPAELVLGVVVNGEPRAYPINMLTGPSREILNDTLGGRPIAATW